MPRVNHPGDVRAATLMHCGRAQRQSFRAAAAAAALVLSSPRTVLDSGFRFSPPASVPPLLLLLLKAPFFWAEFQRQAGRG